MRAWFRVFIALFMLLQFVTIIGCSSFEENGDNVDLIETENGDNADLQETEVLAEKDGLYSETDSDLIISIPDNLSIAQETIVEIYDSASQVPHCRYSTGDPVDIILAEACILYDSYYLFPENLPDSLGLIHDVKEYVTHLRQFDPFTFYLSPEAFSSHKSFREGNLARIGFRYYIDSDMITEENPFIIGDVYPFTRAWLDGLQAGDQIISIDGTQIYGITADTAANMLPHQEGEPVEISVKRNGQEILVSTASEEHIAQMIAPGIAYLNVRSFILNTGSEVKQDFQALQATSQELIVSIILDLRDNPGGSLSGALQLVDYLIDQDSPSKTNPIIIEDGAYYQNSAKYLGDYDSTNIGDYSETSFVVLVDASTASAGEITTAALKFYNEATVMGVQTYGKGVSQFVIELVDGSGVWITSHYVYSPDRESFHQIGVLPDFSIADSPTSFSQDLLLEKALLFLQTGEVAEADFTREQLNKSENNKYYADPFMERLTARGKYWR
jgi:carboxyl-terminal processing protease